MGSAEYKYQISFTSGNSGILWDRVTEYNNITLPCSHGWQTAQGSNMYKSSILECSFTNRDTTPTWGANTSPLWPVINVMSTYKKFLLICSSEICHYLNPLCPVLGTRNMSWFNPIQQLCATQLLTHYPDPVWWRREFRRIKVRKLMGSDKDILKGQKKKKIIIMKELKRTEAQCSCLWLADQCPASSQVVALASFPPSLYIKHDVI